MKNFFKKFAKKETWIWFALSFIYIIPLVLIFDQATKWLFKLLLEENQAVTVIPGFFFFRLQFNTGASWSFLADWGIWGRIILLLISLAMSGLIMFFFIRKFKTLNTLYRVGLTLMAGGAMGNLIDRALYWQAIVGHDGVIDWISFHIPYYAFSKGEWSYYRFPTFNIADSALVIGAIVLLVAVIIDLIVDARKKAKAGEYKYSPKELAKMEKEKSVNQTEEKADAKDNNK